MLLRKMFNVRSGQSTATNRTVSNLQECMEIVVSQKQTNHIVYFFFCLLPAQQNTTKFRVVASSFNIRYGLTQIFAVGNDFLLI